MNFYESWDIEYDPVTGTTKYTVKKPKPLEVLETRPGRCECGSEAAGSMRHSTWCPAFEK